MKTMICRNELFAYIWSCTQYYRRDFQTKFMRFFNSELTFCWLNSESESTFGKITALRIAA